MPPPVSADTQKSGPHCLSRGGHAAQIVFSSLTRRSYSSPSSTNKLGAKCQLAIGHLSCVVALVERFGKHVRRAEIIENRRPQATPQARLVAVRSRRKSSAVNTREAATLLKLGYRALLDATVRGERDRGQARGPDAWRVRGHRRCDSTKFDRRTSTSSAAQLRRRKLSRKTVNNVTAVGCSSPFQRSRGGCCAPSPNRYDDRGSGRSLSHAGPSSVGGSGRRRASSGSIGSFQRYTPVPSTGRLRARVTLRARSKLRQRG